MSCSVVFVFDDAFDVCGWGFAVNWCVLAKTFCNERKNSNKAPNAESSVLFLTMR